MSNGSFPSRTLAFSQDFSDLLERERKSWAQPGVAVAVVDLEQPVLVRGFGVVAAGREDPVNEHTRFALASCSKPFASATVAKLVEAGKLRWDDPVRRHLIEFRLYDKAVTEAVTVRDLLCNRVGLLSSEGRFRRVATDRRDLIRRLAFRRPLHPFRQAYAYQTDMFTVAGELISRVAGMEWSDFARKTFWGPLKMDRTNADHRAAQADHNWARPHRVERGAAFEIPWNYEDHVAVPAGGVNSTAADLSRWLAFWNGRGAWCHSTLLGRESIAEVVARHTPIRGAFADTEFSCATGIGPEGIRSESYALGWYRHNYAGHTVIVHPGSIPGFTAATGFLWNKKRGIAVLANSDAAYFSRAMFQAGIDLSIGRDPEANLARFRRLQKRGSVLQEKARAPGRQQKVSTREFAGRYADEGCWGEMKITHGPAGLGVRCGGQRFRLEALGPDFFSLRPETAVPVRMQVTVRFTRNRDHAVAGFVMDDGIPFKRMKG